MQIMVQTFFWKTRWFQQIIVINLITKLFIPSRIHAYVRLKSGTIQTQAAMVHESLTHKIIGCAMQVHRTLGNGFQEVIYQRALSIEFHLDNLTFNREQEMSIYYRDRVIGKRRVDFFVENTIMVEIKAVTKLDDVHMAQALNYLECYKIPVGLLLNFGQRSLEFKRVHNNRLNVDSCY
jgi:GxxExxY protein